MDNLNLEIMEEILNELEFNYFLGKKQLRILREMDLDISIMSIYEIIDKWALYLSETLYNDKFTKDFLMNLLGKYIKSPNSNLGDF